MSTNEAISNEPDADHQEPEDHYASRCCWSWEKLRILYNVVLFLEGLKFTYESRERIEACIHIGYWFGVIIFGIAANMMYCLGPLFEMYMWGFFRKRIMNWRYVLFTAGLIFSMVFEIWCIAAVSIGCH